MGKITISEIELVLLPPPPTGPSPSNSTTEVRCGLVLSASFCRCPLSETYYCLFAVYILLFISQFDYRLCVCAMSPFRPFCCSAATPGHDYMWGLCLFSPVYVADDDDDDHNN